MISLVANKGGIIFEDFPHITVLLLWSFCPPNPGLYQSCDFLFILPEQILHKYFASRLKSLFQTSTPGLHSYLVELFTSPFRTLLLASVE